MIKHINSITELEDEISKGDVLLDFFATWCGPCRMLSPILEELDQKEDFKIQILKVDTDESLELVRSFQIKSIPTLIYFSQGKAIKKSEGYLREDQIIDFCKK